METDTKCCLPDFGAVIERRCLLGVFLGQRPSLTLVCAPAGYGKSILASQMAAGGGFLEVAWLSGFDEDMRGDQLLISTAIALCLRCGIPIPESDSSSLSRDDALLAIGTALRTRGSSQICVVLDGCDRIEGLSSLQELALLVRASTCPRSSVIVTCRSISPSEALDPAHAWMVEELDLRFSLEEVIRLHAAMGVPSEGTSSPDHLMLRFGGHPALTSLMLRHAGLDEESTPPRDLVWYVHRLVAGLSSQALGFLYVASLLREGTTAVLADCAQRWPGEALWEEIASLSPLLVLPCGPPSTSDGFRVHAVLADRVRCSASSALEPAMTLEARSRVLHQLRQVGAYSRILGILQSGCSESEVVHWCEDCGSSILRFGGTEATTQVLDQVPPARLAASPRLLLLRARVFREQERYEDARSTALLAASLADAEGDKPVWASCLLLVARLCLDSGQWGVLKEVLGQLGTQQQSTLDMSSRRLVDVYMAVADSLTGDVPRATARAEVILKSLAGMDDLGSDEAVFTVNGLATVEGACSGRWATASRLLASVAARSDLSPLQRVLVKANLAACKLELGCLREALALLNGVVDESEAAGLRHLAAHAYGTRSTVCHGLGDDLRGLQDYRTCDALLEALGYDDVRVAERLNAAVSLRALGRYEDALALVESADQMVQQGTRGYLSPEDLVQTELAASLLSLGDLWAARRVAESVRPEIQRNRHQGHLVRVELVLAEGERVSGDLEHAANRLQEYAAYLRTGSANWLIALYIRAFPGLLGVLAKAIGAENIPLRMLLMIPPETLELGIGMAGDYLSEQDASILRHRRGAEGAETHEPEVAPASAVSAHTCYARLFGGLEVTTEAGVVDEASWRKRKARLLFVILALRQHQDIPREVLLERLWPDMDEEHAKRNFYVTWSTMKRALACGGSPAIAKPLVQCSGGVCRATRLVRSDLDEFDEALANLRRAAASGDPGVAIASARLLVDIYRGELLPGDLYEEWLTDTRERAKHDFCDAMMLAASLAETTGDFEAALLFLRKASAADPWREDVYQATMRCQMNSGQRSRAIETYLSCRSRLTEDLGIDPSTETTKLYQAVLAMEDATAED